MVGFLTAVHIFVCILLVTTILMQAGRGGGLAEGFNSAENLLGAQTNAVMVKVTAVLGLLFLATCLSLAVLSSKQEHSLMNRHAARSTTKTVDVNKLFDQAPSQTITLNAETPVNEAK